MSCYNGAWKNRRSPLYTQYCNLDECGAKLLRILQLYGTAFDDEWKYRIAGRKKKVVVREPLWLSSPESGRFCEKPKLRQHTEKRELMEFMRA